MKKTFLASLSWLALTAVSISQPAYKPVPITDTSYNQDLVVESNATPSLRVVTTATVDEGTNNMNNTWFEQGYDGANPENGLPPANSVFTAQDNANYTFRAPPTYAAPDGILIDTVVTNGTFTLTSPAAYSLLSFLGAGGNGGDVIGVRVNHADGTFEVGSFGSPDWFGGTGVAYTVGGRCQSPITFTTETDGNNPRIYFRDVALTNHTSPVTNIVLTYTSGSGSSHNDIMGVSGATTPGGLVTPIAVTGFTYDFTVEASAPSRGRVVSQTMVDGTNVWATTATMDNDGNTGNTFYERGHNYNMLCNSGPIIYSNPVVDAIAQASGIPVHGSTFTNDAGNHSYTMAADYTTNDVVYISPVFTNATITLVTPQAYTALSFLDAAGNGPVNPVVIVHHQNGSSETNVLIIVDWFDSSTSAYIPNGRVAANTAEWDQQYFDKTMSSGRLFSTDLPLVETASPVTSIDLVYTNTGGRAAIFALSGTTGPVPPFFTGQPTSTNTYAGSPISFSVHVIGSAPFTYQWQKGTNGVFANLIDGGAVSGATTATLSISNANYFSDAAEFRVVASNAGGSVTSSVATATLLSTLTDVTQPGDPITFFGGSLFSDGAVSQAIDNDVGTKWGADTSLPIGCVITPTAGATLVTGMRFYTANDSPGRDPADYKLEGSVNNGAMYTLIASNSMTLPNGRNTTPGPPDPLVDFVREVSFENTSGYTSYRLTFSHLKGGDSSGSFQLGEVELLGVTTNLPLLVEVPSTGKAFNGTALSIAATVSGTPAPNSRWQKQIANVFTDLSDGGTISGSHTPTLTIDPATFSDAGNFRLIATNSLITVTSAVVQVTIYDTNVDVTVPSDTITDFGNTSTTAATPGRAIDDEYDAFTTRGSGLNNNAGFPPFGGPVGLVVTPGVGTTLVTGLRLYPGSDGVESDPADVQLEGSNDGGTNYTTILPTTALAIPQDRNTLAVPPIDPLTASVQELRFANAQAYTSYRLTFNTVTQPNNTYFLSLGELELLGVPATLRPVISGIGRSDGNLLISGSGGTPNGTYTVLTNSLVEAPLTSWGTNSTGVFDASGNFSATLPISPSHAHLFYLIKTP
jgi:hypothetical protein